MCNITYRTGSQIFCPMPRHFRDPTLLCLVVFSSRLSFEDGNRSFSVDTRWSLPGSVCNGILRKPRDQLKFPTVQLLPNVVSRETGNPSCISHAPFSTRWVGQEVRFLSTVTVMTPVKTPDVTLSRVSLVTGEVGYPRTFRDKTHSMVAVVGT